MDELFGLLEESFPKELKDKGKLWIYRNKTIVYDIVINENIIAFDITPNFVDNNVKIELFSRNMPDSLKEFEKGSISVFKNKLLIYDDTINVDNFLKTICNIYSKIESFKKSDIDLFFDNLSLKVDKSEFIDRFYVWRQRHIDLTFIIDGQELAFNINPDFKNNRVKLWLFSKNNSDSIDKYKELALDINSKLNRLLILDISLNELELLATTINKFIYKMILDYKFNNNEGHTKVLDRIKNKIANNQKVEVAFFVNDTTKWNMQIVYDYFMNSDLFNVSVEVFSDNNIVTGNVIRTDIFNKNFTYYSNKLSNTKKAFDLEKQKNIPVLDLETKYDLVFFQQPWSFKNSPLKLYGRSLTFYTSYFFHSICIPTAHCQISFHGYLWRHYSQDKYHKDYLDKYLKVKKGELKTVGYPKFDILNNLDLSKFEWMGNNKIKIIYAPHHSLGKNKVSLGTFDWNYFVFSNLRDKYKNISWLYKPHTSLKNRVLPYMSYEDYISYENSWENNINSRVYLDGDYFPAFSTSTIMITDCGSFLGEYLYTGNPVIRIVSKYYGEKFDTLGEKINSVYYNVHTVEEIEQVFHDLVILGKDPLKEARHALRDELFGDGFNASKRIIEDIESSLEIKGIK